MFRKRIPDDTLLAEAEERLKELVAAAAERHQAELQHTLSVALAETSSPASASSSRSSSPGGGRT